MIKGHKIERKIKIKDYLAIISNFTEEQIYTTDHTFFRLKEKERKVFKDRLIKEFILGQDPILVGIQYNRNYAVFYKHKKDILKIILDIQPTKINVVTFYIIDNKQIPRIK